MVLSQEPGDKTLIKTDKPFCLVSQIDESISQIDRWKHINSAKLQLSQSERSKASQSDGRIQSQSVGQVSETDGDEEIKVGELDGAAVQMAVETDPSPS